MSENERYRSPAETAKRLGVTGKALRLYESHGLVTPLRTASGWRTYGPAQIARLHQVIALKRLGLSLAHIGALLKGRNADLASVLALQETVLVGECSRVAGALALVRSARNQLAAGIALSIDDLATLTKETTMTTKATPAEMKNIFDPLIEKYFSQADRDALSNREFDQEQITREWDALFADATALMAKGDATSPAALDLARRWKAQFEKFTMGNPQFAQKAGAVWKDAMADGKSAPRLPMPPEMFAFIGKAQAKLKELGE